MGKVMEGERSPFAPRLPEDTITPSKRDYQIQELKKDLEKAKTLKQYAWEAIQLGTDPAYVAMRYGFTLEEMLRAKAEHQRREEERKARAARGDKS
jgi:hypothetical protein